MKFEDMPCACSKNELISFLNKIPIRDVKQATFDAIMKLRKCNLQKAKNVKVLRKNEVKLILIELGELE